MKIRIDDRPHLAAEEQPGTLELDSSLARFPAEGAGILSDDGTDPTVDSQPCRQVIRHLEIDLFITQIDSGDLGIVEEKLIA